MINLVLFLLVAAFTLEIVGTALLIGRLYRRVHMVMAWIAAIDEVQDWQLEEQLRNEDFKMAVTSALSLVRHSINRVGGSSVDGGATQPLEDCWTPDKNNFDSYDDEREWKAYLVTHPEAVRCNEQPNERPYWTTSFDGDPDTSDPTTRSHTE